MLWDKLPPRMAIHWNASGHVDGYAGRGFAAFFVPCVNIGQALLLGALPFIDRRVRAYDEAARANLHRVARVLRLALTAFMSAVLLAILAVAIRVPTNMTLVIAIGSALLFIVLGNGLTKLRPNNYIGIRTKWTLESKEVWIKTHRLAGKLLVGGGILLIPLSLVVPSEHYLYFVFLPLLFVMLGIPAVFSYW
jgi:uncharacterized membrane protein